MGARITIPRLRLSVACAVADMGDAHCPLARHHVFKSRSAEPILRGIFDIASPQSDVFATCIQFAAVTWSALLVGTAMGVSSRLVVCNAHLRFRATPVALSPGLELIFRFIPLLSFTAVVGTALFRSAAPWPGKLLGLILGAGFWYAATIAARDLLSSLHTRLIAGFRAGAWVPKNESGYLDFERGTIQPRHLFATYQLLLALAVYLIYCIAPDVDLALFNGHFHVPTLSLVLLMLALLCWGLAGVAFFLDRYRIPLLLPLAAMTFSSGLFPQSDYFYEGLPRPSNTSAPLPLTAADLIALHEKGPDSNTPIILVATTGGGIQSAGWTARVLTGLNQEIALPSGNGPGAGFSHHVRLISSVSGGSVGAMFFAAAYQNGEVPKNIAARIVASAEQSSLDQVTWGLAYPDLLFGLLPAFKGIGVSSGAIRTSDSGFIFSTADACSNQVGVTASRQTKGTPLSLAGKTTPPTPSAPPSSSIPLWSKPATATFFQPPASKGPAETKPRLSSTKAAGNFSSSIRIQTCMSVLPLGSPPLFPTSLPPRACCVTIRTQSKDGRFYRPEPHAVDGGYYDNYGMASLLDWLNNGLQAAHQRFIRRS